MKKTRKIQELNFKKKKAFFKVNDDKQRSKRTYLIYILEYFKIALDHINLPYPFFRPSHPKFDILKRDRFNSRRIYIGMV